MTFQISQRASRVRLSPNATANQRAANLRAEGIDVINMSMGEPDFDTPDNVKNAGFAAMQRGETKYTLTQGTPALRTAIAEKLARENNLSYRPDEIIVGNGAKQIISGAFHATLDERWEVIAPAPCWSIFSDTPPVLDAKTVVIPCGIETGFKLTPDVLAKAITPKTRWLVLNTPNNPTGAVYNSEELAALAEVIRKHPDLLVMLDEIYEHIRFIPSAPVHFLQIAPDLKERTLIVNGVSKSHAMTGWRIGYGAGPKPLIDAMIVMQSQFTSGPSSIGQAAALEALTGPQDFVVSANEAYRKRRDVMVEGLSAIPGIDIATPDGAFFVYPSCAGLIGKSRPDGTIIKTDQDFVDYLIDEARIVSVSGASFCLSPYFRLSFAASEETIKDALERIKQAVLKLR